MQARGFEYQAIFHEYHHAAWWSVLGRQRYFQCPSFETKMKIREWPQSNGPSWLWSTAFQGEENSHHLEHRDLMESDRPLQHQEDIGLVNDPGPSESALLHEPFHIDQPWAQTAAFFGCVGERCAHSLFLARVCLIFLALYFLPWVLVSSPDMRWLLQV